MKRRDFLRAAAATALGEREPCGLLPALVRGVFGMAAATRDFA